MGVKFWVKGGGRHEFSMTDSNGRKVPRLERMLREACLRFNLKLEPEDITVKPDGPVAPNGVSGPLQLKVELSEDVLDEIAPRLEPKGTSTRSDTKLRRFVQALGETARRLGPENGWPERHVRVQETVVGISWNG